MLTWGTVELFVEANFPQTDHEEEEDDRPDHGKRARLHLDNL